MRAAAEEARLKQEKEEAEQQAAELKEALKLSMVEPAADAEGVVSITMRLPSGSRITRRFVKDDTVGTIYDYVRTLDDLGFDNPSADF